MQISTTESALKGLPSPRKSLVNAYRQSKPTAKNTTLTSTNKKDFAQFNSRVQMIAMENDNILGSLVEDEPESPVKRTSKDSLINQYRVFEDSEIGANKIVRAKRNSKKATNMVQDGYSAPYHKADEGELRDLIKMINKDKEEAGERKKRRKELLKTTNEEIKKTKGQQIVRGIQNVAVYNDTKQDRNNIVVYDKKIGVSPVPMIYFLEDKKNSGNLRVEAVDVNKSHLEDLVSDVNNDKDVSGATTPEKKIEPLSNKSIHVVETSGKKIVSHSNKDQGSSKRGSPNKSQQLSVISIPLTPYNNKTKIDSPRSLKELKDMKNYKSLEELDPTKGEVLESHSITAGPSPVTSKQELFHKSISNQSSNSSRSSKSFAELIKSQKLSALKSGIIDTKAFISELVYVYVDQREISALNKIRLDSDVDNTSKESYSDTVKVQIRGSQPIPSDRRYSAKDISYTNKGSEYKSYIKNKALESYMKMSRLLRVQKRASEKIVNKSAVQYKSEFREHKPDRLDNNKVKSVDNEFKKSEATDLSSHSDIDTDLPLVVKLVERRNSSKKHHKNFFHSQVNGDDTSYNTQGSAVDLATKYRTQAMDDYKNYLNEIDIEPFLKTNKKEVLKVSEVTKTHKTADIPSIFHQSSDKSVLKQQQIDQTRIVPKDTVQMKNKMIKVVVKKQEAVIDKKSRVTNMTRSKLDISQMEVFKDDFDSGHTEPIRNFTKAQEEQAFYVSHKTVDKIEFKSVTSSSHKQEKTYKVVQPLHEDYNLMPHKIPQISVQRESEQVSKESKHSRSSSRSEHDTKRTTQKREELVGNDDKIAQTGRLMSKLPPPNLKEQQVRSALTEVHHHQIHRDDASRLYVEGGRSYVDKKPSGIKGSHKKIELIKGHSRLGNSSRSSRNSSKEKADNKSDLAAPADTSVILNSFKTAVIPDGDPGAKINDTTEVELIRNNRNFTFSYNKTVKEKTVKIETNGDRVEKTRDRNFTFKHEGGKVTQLRADDTGQVETRLSRLVEEKRFSLDSLNLKSVDGLEDLPSPDFTDRLPIDDENNRLNAVDLDSLHSASFKPKDPLHRSRKSTSRFSQRSIKSSDSLSKTLEYIETLSAGDKPEEDNKNDGIEMTIYESKSLKRKLSNKSSEDESDGHRADQHRPVNLEQIEAPHTTNEEFTNKRLADIKVEIASAKKLDYIHVARSNRWIDYQRPKEIVDLGASEERNIDFRDFLLRNDPEAIEDQTLAIKRNIERVRDINRKLIRENTELKTTLQATDEANAEVLTKIELFKKTADLRGLTNNTNSGKLGYFNRKLERLEKEVFDNKKTVGGIFHRIVNLNIEHTKFRTHELKEMEHLRTVHYNDLSMRKSLKIIEANKTVPREF